MTRNECGNGMVNANFWTAVYLLSVAALLLELVPIKTHFAAAILGRFVFLSLATKMVRQFWRAFSPLRLTCIGHNALMEA